MRHTNTVLKLEPKAEATPQQELVNMLLATSTFASKAAEGAAPLARQRFFALRDTLRATATSITREVPDANTL